MSSYPGEKENSQAYPSLHIFSLVLSMDISSSGSVRVYHSTRGLKSRKAFDCGSQLPDGG